MTGTRAGGLKAAATNKERSGEDFYRNIGRLGGKAGHGGGFASKTVGKDGLTGRERASRAGAIGGRISKRGPAKKKDDCEIGQDVRVEERLGNVEIDGRSCRVIP